MWRRLRIVILLVILASVAQSAWLARTRTAEWRTSLRVVIYPINGDDSATVTAYISELDTQAFDVIETFFETEAKHYGLELSDPIDTFLAPQIAARPPAPPFAGSVPEIMLWSLRLRFWAWRHDTHTGPQPDVRLFVVCFDPAQSTTLAHSTGLQKGMLGVVNVFASADQEGSNAVVIAHELMHTFGATDKYDARTNAPSFPEGYADPEARPLHPQRRAEIMAGRIPITETHSEIPRNLKRVVIGEKTAREINWLK
jgi:hypothetical protein